MRQVICLAVLALCLFPMPGCDSKQPQEIGSQTMQILIEAGNASAGVYDTWEQYFDVNGDGIPDATDPAGNILPEPVQVVCRRATAPGGALVLGSGSTPWAYALEISIIRAGTTVIERVTTTEALNSTFNLTPYADDFLNGAQLPGGDCPALAVCNPIGRVLGTNRLVIDSSYPTCPGSPGLGEPRMSGTLAAPLPAPFTLGVEKGDTVIVKARKSITPPEGVELFSEPVLQGSVFLNGLEIRNLSGTSVSTSEQAAGISFSFTVN